MLPRRLLVAVHIENMDKDMEMIERMIYKSGDDIAVSVARSFERLEERLDAAESRIYSRLTDIEGEIKDELLAVRGIIEDKGEALVVEA